MSAGLTSVLTLDFSVPFCSTVGWLQTLTKKKVSGLLSLKKIFLYKIRKGFECAQSNTFNWHLLAEIKGALNFRRPNSLSLFSLYLSLQLSEPWGVGGRVCCCHLHGPLCCTSLAAFFFGEGLLAIYFHSGCLFGAVNGLRSRPPQKPFVPWLHHIHHVMPVRQIWLDISVTLMCFQRASGLVVANLSLFCFSLYFYLCPSPWFPPLPY